MYDPVCVYIDIHKENKVKKNSDVEHQSIKWLCTSSSPHLYLYLSSVSSRLSITFSQDVRLVVKRSKSVVTQQWLSVGSLPLWLVAVSVGFSMEPREAAV